MTVVNETKTSITIQKPDDPALAELLWWWLTTAVEDFDLAVPKALEYGGDGSGSADLRVMGDALGEFTGMRDAEEAVRSELACWLYLTGKVSRLISDYRQGKAGKPDTIQDATIYTYMMRRIQSEGVWP